MAKHKLDALTGAKRIRVQREGRLNEKGHDSIGIKKILGIKNRYFISY